MDKYTIITIIILGGVVIMLFLITFFLKYSIKKDEIDKENNKRIILFNRRTRKIKEVFNKNYIESKSWEKIAVIYEDRFSDFMNYLKTSNVINEENKYIGKTNKGILLLRWRFKKFIHELSEI